MLNTGEDVAGTVIEDEGAREIDHNHKHHEWHNERHLAGHGLADFGLVGFFAVGGFAHELAESFAVLRFVGGELLAGDPMLSEGRSDGEKQHDESGK